jgi:hypothetical protein
MTNCIGPERKGRVSLTLGATRALNGQATSLYLDAQGAGSQAELVWQPDTRRPVSGPEIDSDERRDPPPVEGSSGRPKGRSAAPRCQTLQHPPRFVLPDLVNRFRRQRGRSRNRFHVGEVVRIARQWLIDNDLWDNSVGMPPEMHDRAAPRRRCNHYRCSITDTVPSSELVT